MIIIRCNCFPACTSVKAATSLIKEQKENLPFSVVVKMTPTETKTSLKLGVLRTRPRLSISKIEAKQKNKMTSIFQYPYRSATSFSKVCLDIFIHIFLFCQLFWTIFKKTLLHFYFNCIYLFIFLHLFCFILFYFKWSQDQDQPPVLQHDHLEPVLLIQLFIFFHHLQPVCLFFISIILFLLLFSRRTHVLNCTSLGGEFSLSSFDLADLWQTTPAAAWTASCSWN